MSSKSGSRTPTHTGSPSSFFRDELKHAFDEHAFGIVRYIPGQSSEFEANATVTLLENVHLEITLTLRGYQVKAVRGLSGEKLSTQFDHLTFETVEALLMRCSAKYVSRQAETLFAKLAK